jgi:predicted ATP-grasp superfamily ATP-dependent carboligase
MAELSLERLGRGRPPAVVLGDLSLVRPHGMAGIPVVLATDDPEDPTRWSRHVRHTAVLPGYDDRNRHRSAQVLLDLGARLHDALGLKVPLVYCTDPQLTLVYENRRALAEHFLFTLNDEPLASALHDKERFYPAAEAAGLRVPRTRRAGVEVSRALAELREPLLVKPRSKSDWEALRRSLFQGHGKARVFATRRELLASPAFRRYENEVIVQEHIEGDATSLVSFHAFSDVEGNVLASFCGRKVRTWPAFAGESACIELTGDPAVEATGRVVAARFGLKGPFKVDLIRDANGGLYVLEINARYNLWHYLGAVHGVNLPAIAYEYQMEGKRPAVTPRCSPRYRWVDLYKDHCAFLDEHANDGRGLARWLWSVASPYTISDTFAWSDPAPMLAWTRRFLRGRSVHGALWNHFGHPR